MGSCVGYAFIIRRMQTRHNQLEKNVGSFTCCRWNRNILYNTS